MAVLSGFVAYQDPALTRQPCRLSTDLDTLAVDYWPAHANDGDLHRTGSAVFHLPSAIAHGPIGAFIPKHYGDDWYYRIHMVPNPVRLGNVISAQQRTVELWNAYLDSGQALNLLIPANDSGLILTAPFPPPTTFQPNESRLYILSVSVQGSPVINAQYDFYFSVGTVRLLVTGQRVIAFGFEPNWAEQVKEWLEWLTDVITAHSGAEQRRGLRGLPRTGMEFEALIRAADKRYLDNILREWQSRSFAVPLWWDPCRLTAAAATGATVLTVDATADRGFQVGQLLIIWASARAQETVEVAAIAATTLTLALPLASAWPKNTLVYPAQIAQLAQTQGLDRRTAGAATARFAFQFIYPGAGTATESGAIYRAEPVFFDKPNWASDMSDEFERQLEILDYQTGARFIEDESNREKWFLTASWPLTSKAKRATFRRWLYARAGQYNGVWLPTHNADLIVTDTINSVDTVINIQYCGYALYGAQAIGRRDIAIFANNVVYMRRITGSAEISNNREQLSINQSLGVTLQPSQVTRISFLKYARLAADRVEISHHTCAVAECKLTFASIDDDL